MKTAAILIADGFEEAEALVPFDILSRAGVQTDLVSVSGKSSAAGARGLVIENLIPMDGYVFADADALILPGGGGGYEILKASKVVCDQAKAFAADPEKILGGICASGALLGELGLLKGLDYTCDPTMNGDFGGTYRPHDHAVVAGHIVTGVGPGGAFAFGFDLAEKLAGRETAEKLRREMCWDLD